MGRYCQVCGKRDVWNSSVSFHKFPSNPIRREKWLNILEIDSRAVPQSIFLCQDHFLKEDFEINKSGNKYLKTGVNPIPKLYNENKLYAEPSTSSTKIQADVTVGSSPIFSEEEKGAGSSGLTTLTTFNPEMVNWAIGLQWNHSRYCQEGMIQVARKVMGSVQYMNLVCSKCAFSEDRLLPLVGLVADAKISSFDEPENVLSVFSLSHRQNKSPCSVEASSSTKSASETEEQLIKLIYSRKGGHISPNIVGPESDFRGRLGLINIPLKRKRKYIGDLSSEDFSTPRKAKRNFRELEKTVVRQTSRIKSLQVTVSRLSSKINTLNDLLKLLKKKTYITESAESSLKASLTDKAKTIFERMLKGPSKQKYDPMIRSFALTLSFYSPRAYNFGRSTFNRTLPHLVTISKWLITVDGSPGFTKEALTALKLKSEEASPCGKHVICNLVFDEMAIRKQVEWTGTKFTGHVNIGSKLEGDMIPAAKEALVFMLVALNSPWKIPIGYFSLDGLSGIEKAELLKKCLGFIHETGVTVSSITCDGAPTNLGMMKTLGADFSNPKDLKTHFLHPTTNEKVFIFLDACHMLKLIRNCFGSVQILKHGRHIIQWNYLNKLVELQEVEGLHAATKIRPRHFQWAREKMKVNLATQTISKSVADALLYLGKDLNIPEFTNVAPTADFISKFNNLFDIFNSKNRFAKYIFKRPLSLATAEFFFSFLDEIVTYIYGLSIADVPILNSSRKTGVLGFLICIESLKSIYETYINEKETLKYILTYKFSQDHLELFFGSIRSKGGYNNNPTARQFEAAYKRLIVHSEIASPNTGNVKNLENIPILTCGSHSFSRYDLDNHQFVEYHNFYQFIRNEIIQYSCTSPTWHLTDYTRDIVMYISGFVVRTLQKFVSCVKCLSLLETDEILSDLQKRKSFGSLKVASLFVVRVCQTAEKVFRHHQKIDSIFNPKIKNLLLFLVTNTMQLLPSNIYDSFGDHLYDEDPIDGHSSILIKLILRKYFNLRIHHETTKMQSKELRVRSLLTKVITFKGQ